MRKIAVVYKSKHGSTKQYAQWIAEETGADLFDADTCKGSDVSDYDTIVFGGCIHGGGIQGIDFLKKNMKTFCVKDVFAFAVGLNVDGIEARQQCREINFVKDMEHIPCYFFRGAYDPAVVKGIDKVIMGLVKKMVPDHNRELRDAIENGANYVDREEIKYLVAELKKEE